MTQSRKAMQTKLCCFVVPYFGKLPETMPVFLKTTENNPAYHWLLYTDDQTAYPYPENVFVKYCEFTEFVNRIQANFNFKIALSSPKKLCDFKPAFGHILAEELKEYAFWGYCDLDEYFGDLEQFIPKEFLFSYDKIFNHGHMTIYRNTEKMRYLYQTKCEFQPAKWKDYREVFTNDQNVAFDELDMNQLIKWQEGIKSCYKWVMADVLPYKSRFLGAIWRPEEDSSKIDPFRNFIVYWENGRLYLYGKEDKGFVKKEVLYVHLQKRNLRMVHYDQNSNRFVIFPNKITFLAESDSTEQILKKYYRVSFIKGMIRKDEICRMIEKWCFLWKHRVRKYILHEKT